MEDGRSLHASQPVTLPDFPATHFFPSFAANRSPPHARPAKLHTGVWLLVRLRLRRDANSLTSGGRSLRNVAQRRSIRAELLNGSPGAVDLPEGEATGLFALLLLANPGKPAPPLQRLLSLPLIAAPPDLLPDHLSSLDHHRLTSLRTMAKVPSFPFWSEKDSKRELC